MTIMPGQWQLPGLKQEIAPAHTRMKGLFTQQHDESKRESTMTGFQAVFKQLFGIEDSRNREVAAALEEERDPSKNRAVVELAEHMMAVSPVKESREKCLKWALEYRKTMLQQVTRCVWPDCA